MNRETFIKGLEITLSKTNMPNGNGINLESICKDFALLAYDEALILHNVVQQSELLKSKERLDYKSWKKAMGYERLEKPVMKRGNDYIEVEKVMLEFDEYERTF